MQISADAVVKTEITEEEFNEELKIQKDIQQLAILSTAKRPTWNFGIPNRCRREATGKIASTGSRRPSGEISSTRSSSTTQGNGLLLEAAT